MKATHYPPSRGYGTNGTKHRDSPVPLVTTIRTTSRSHYVVMGLVVPVVVLLRNTPWWFVRVL